MSDGERMSPVDRAWLLMERPTNPMMIVAVIVLGGKIRRAQLRQLVERRMLAFERFRCRPVADAFAAHWVRSEPFTLDDHVLSAALPAPAGQRELETLVGELAGTPFNPLRPWWTFHVVERLGRGSAIIARIHHCYADGMALMRVLLGLADGDPPPHPAPVPREATGRSGASALGELYEPLASLLSSGAHYLLHPREAVGIAADAAGLLAELARLAVLPDDPPTPLKQPLSGSRRVAWAAPMPFDEVRTLAHALDCTVNDVLMATLAGALGQYLESRGAVSQELTLHAAVPVNLRTEHETLATLGNRFGLVFVELPVGTRDALERLQRVRDSMRKLKASPQAALTFGLLATVGSLPEAVEHTAIEAFTAKASLVASNVPGPRTAIRIAGVAVRQLLFWVPQAGSIGTGVSMLSYDDELQFGVIADRQLVPEPAELVASFTAEFERLVLLTLLSS